jgi:hypothetical protein
MDYMIKTIPMNQIEAGGVVLAKDGREALRKIFRVAENFGVHRPILVLHAGDEFRFIAGTLQFLAKRNLNIPETECIVFRDQPPQELELLIEEFGRKGSNPVTS